MGPRLGSRGKIPLGSPVKGPIDRFNGAATWKSRKAIEPKIAEVFRALLQWGRDLEVAESGSFTLRVGRFNLASMGPRLGSRGKASRQQLFRLAGWLQWGRDLEVAERKTQRRMMLRKLCFNGAATWKSRKVHRVGDP